MTINCMENNTRVMTPDGEGRVELTRRERQLWSDGKLIATTVRFKDCNVYSYPVDEITEIIEEPVEMYFKEDLMEDVSIAEDIEDLKVVILKIINKVF